MSERGEIKFKNRGAQLNSFKGMVRRRNITPTDIDGFIDYNGNAFIILEGKLNGAPFNYGQKLALENICKNSNVPCLVILFEHNTPTNEEVDVKNQPVKSVYYNGSWKHLEDKNVLDTIVEMEKYWDNLNIKL